MSNVYLKIDYSTAKVYEYSKEKKEGFEEHKSDKGTVSYRRYFPRGVYGTLRGVTIREVEFSGSKTKEVSIAMRDKDQNNVYLNIPLFDGKKNITDYAEGVISHLNSLEAGKGYRIYPFNIRENDSKYSTVGVSFKYADVEKEEVDKDTVIPKLTKTINKKDGTVIEGDIPAVTWEQDVDDSWTKNAKARNKYLFDVLKAYTEGTPVADIPAPQKDAPKPEPKREEPKNVMQPNTTFEDDGQLPF